MELEDWAGPHACRRSNHFLDRNDDLRTDAIVVLGRIQGIAATPEGMRWVESQRTRQNRKDKLRTAVPSCNFVPLLVSALKLPLAAPAPHLSSSPARP